MRCGNMIVCCPAAGSPPPPSPLPTKNIRVNCVSNLEKYSGWENKQKVGWILRGGGGKAAVVGAIFSTSISLKNITHCRLAVWWKGKWVLCRKPLSWFSPSRFSSLRCFQSTRSLSVWCLTIMLNYGAMLITVPVEKGDLLWKMPVAMLQILFWTLFTGLWLLPL